MKFTYDKSSDAAYLQLVEVDNERGVAAETRPLSEDIIVDYDANGRLFGIEFLNASTHLPESLLSQAASPRKKSA